ncbi:hypothetical protein GCM10010191_00130 [Actinomadura vinacea]|uniref:HEAT repeat domain-containing protein n=1 Tax=Actinomadura vinacea TaxID=115336 RepID=A0ABN3I9Q0_9ACTN
MAMHSSRRLILRSNVVDADIWGFAERQGWTYLGHVPRDSERGVFYEARWEVNDGNTVHFVIDEFADVLYMVVQHHDPKATAKLARRIEDGLPVQSLEALAEEFDVNMYPAGWAKAVLALGVGAPRSMYEEFLNRIRESIGHREARVRSAAVWAMRYAAWPELRQFLERMAQSETDPDVAGEIARAMEVFAAEYG